MASARSILPRAATMTAVKCSAALPAMGSTIRPRKGRPTPVPALTSSMQPVRNLRTKDCEVRARERVRSRLNLAYGKD